MTKPLKLTDQQLMLLAAASQREDRLLALPDTLNGRSARALVSKLLAGGLVEEITLSPADPQWRANENDAQAVGLRITPAGLQAIGAEEEPGTGIAGPRQDSPAPDAADPGEPAPGTLTEPAGARELPVTAQPSAPREGTKQALVLSLLSRPEGATLDDLLSATGWLPHTTRAALTGLRQRGYPITRDKDAGQESVYRVAPAADPVSAQAAQEPAEV
jgi:Protein of unknown function (DUF3489)